MINPESIFLAINILATLFTAYWLIKKINYQNLIINSQSEKLNELKKFGEIFGIFSEYTKPELIKKLLDTERELMKQDTELIRRKTISETNEMLSKQWSTRYEVELKPIYEKSFQEFSDFVIVYFSQSHFPDKNLRNEHIRIYFPTVGETLIKYLDEVKNENSEKEDA